MSEENTRRHVTNVDDTMRKIDSGPSVHNTSKKPHKQVPVDLIEEENMESFPASDPPAHVRTNKNRGEPTKPGRE